MTEVTALPPTAPADLVEHAADRARHYAAQAFAPATQRAYQRGLTW